MSREEEVQSVEEGKRTTPRPPVLQGLEVRGCVRTDKGYMQQFDMIYAEDEKMFDPETNAPYYVRVAVRRSLYCRQDDRKLVLRMLKKVSG
ncbi:MAG: hypothetical protein JW724_03200 [Candidatus Altiarchaeota archaeon]|nr:hypothetical protein [Candidatus Altiarchaeota archaeon]